MFCICLFFQTCLLGGNLQLPEPCLRIRHSMTKQVISSSADGGKAAPARAQLAIGMVGHGIGVSMDNLTLRVWRCMALRHLFGGRPCK